MASASATGRFGVFSSGIRSRHASEQEREDIEAAREDWFEGQLDLDPEKLVFLDETSISTSMARRYGWAPQGALPGVGSVRTLESHDAHRRVALSTRR